MKKFSILIKLVITIIVTSCSTNVGITEQKINNRKIVNIIKHKQDLIQQKLETWILKAKISWYNPNNKNINNCYLYWEKKTDRSVIHLYSLFKIQSIMIEITDTHKIKVISKNGKNYQHKIEKKIKSFDLPLIIEHLAYWIFQTPAPKTNHLIKKDGFDQNGWKIRSIDPNHIMVIPNLLWIPKRLTLEKLNFNKEPATIIKMIITNFEQTN